MGCHSHNAAAKQQLQKGSSVQQQHASRRMHGPRRSSRRPPRLQAADGTCSVKALVDITSLASRFDGTCSVKAQSRFDGTCSVKAQRTLRYHTKIKKCYLRLPCLCIK